MSLLPEGWCSVPLADVVNVQWGDTSITKKSYTEKGHTAFSATGPDGKLPMNQFEQPGIVLSAIGARCGRCFLADGKWSAIKNTITITDLHVERDLLYYFLNSPEVWPKKGGAQPFITLGDARKVTVPVPPLPEQRRIVAKLDRLSARSSEARTHLTRVTTLATRAKQAILAAELENLSADNTLIGDLAESIRYGTSKKCSYENGITPVLRIPNVAGGKIDTNDIKFADFDEKEQRKLALKSGDILLIRSNGSLDLVGRSARVGPEHAGYLFAGYMIRLRFDLERTNPDFIQLILNSASTRMFIEQLAKSTSGVNNINSGQIASIPMPDIDIALQSEIVRRIEAAFARIDRLTEEATRAAHLLDRLDQRLLAKAFLGELVPQDPSDEPAETLLARIREARASSPKTSRRRRA